MYIYPLCRGQRGYIPFLTMSKILGGNKKKKKKKKKQTKKKQTKKKFARPSLLSKRAAHESVNSYFDKVFVLSGDEGGWGSSKHRLRAQGVASERIRANTNATVKISTFVKLIKLSAARGHRRILILTDGLRLHNNFQEKFLDFVTGIPNRWKVLCLTSSPHVPGVCVYCFPFYSTLGFMAFLLLKNAILKQLKKSTSLLFESKFFNCCIFLRI